MATTPAELRQGLKDLERPQALALPVDRPTAITMVGVRFPLDLVMLAPSLNGGTSRIIYAIYRNWPPTSANLTVHESVDFVLELPAGTVQRLGLRVGEHAFVARVAS